MDAVMPDKKPANDDQLELCCKNISSWVSEASKYASSRPSSEAKPHGQNPTAVRKPEDQRR